MKNSNIIIRSVVDIALCISIFLLPWWISCIIAIIGLLLFRNYIEIIIFAFGVDLLYRTQGFEFYATLYAVILYSVVFVFKKQLRKGTI